MKWIELNNQVIVRDEFEKYQLGKDKEILESFRAWRPSLSWRKARTNSFYQLTAKVNKLWTR